MSLMLGQIRNFVSAKSALFGVTLLVIFLVVALFAPWLAPHDPLGVNSEALRIPPAWNESGSAQHLFGTDDVGRDLLSRLIYGARVSLGVGFWVVLISTLFGTLLGLLAGYFGGWLDQVISRAMDVLMALPSMLAAIVIVTLLGPGLSNAVIAVSIVGLPGFVRLVRAAALTERSKTYVTAAQTFGASHTRQLFWNILPNCVGPIIVQATLSFSNGILDVAALGFLGLGAEPPTPEWGTMLSDARQYIESAPWMVTLPGVAILLSVLAFNLLGDALRDRLDPRLRKIA